MTHAIFDWLKNRAEDYSKNRAAAIKAHATRWANVQAKRNNGDLPTESVREDGVIRFHAPYDGYIHVWYRGDVECEAEYLGGQFLPYDSENDYSGSFGFDQSIKIWDVPSDRAVKFEEQWKAAEIVEINLRVTNEYPQKKSGEPVRMVELSHAPSDVVSKVSDFLMGDIYARQRLAEEKEQAERDARDLAHRRGEDVPSGRQVIVGVILGMKWKESYYGKTLKMLVQDDRGFRVWGTVPSSLADDDVNREDRIEFTATVEQSPDDSKFGFFKRPTKARVLREDEVAQAA